MKSMASLPSEMRPVGWPKKVIPYGGLIISRLGVVGPPMITKLPVSAKESPKLKMEVWLTWIEQGKLQGSRRTRKGRGTRRRIVVDDRPSTTAAIRSEKGIQR
jgi:hypothetical protein